MNTEQKIKANFRNDTIHRQALLELLKKIEELEERIERLEK